MELAIVAAGLVINIATLIVAGLKLGPAKRARRRSEVASLAVDYAEQMGGTAEQKRAHAISAAQRIDAADNGKRDYSDAELYIEIEACLGRRRAG